MISLYKSNSYLCSLFWEIFHREKGKNSSGTPGHVRLADTPWLCCRRKAELGEENNAKKSENGEVCS